MHFSARLSVSKKYLSNKKRTTELQRKAEDSIKEATDKHGLNTDKALLLKQKVAKTAKKKCG